MQYKEKILTYKELADIVKQAQREQLRIALCHGHFNVIHPGHLRFLQYAQEQGDRLLVMILSDQALKGTAKITYFTQTERAAGVAALHNVDWIVILDRISMIEVIRLIRPFAYVLGKEFEENHSSEIDQCIELVKKNNGKIVFSSGTTHYASVDFLYHSQEELGHDNIQKFYAVCKNQKIDLKTLKYGIDQFQNLNLAVIGDTIVDQYIACDALGMSAEAPVIAVKELETKEFLGGAAIVASHLVALGAQCHFLSVIGEDQTAELVRAELAQQKVDADLFRDSSRPTTFKIRYMVNNQKLFRVSRLQEHSISKTLELKISAQLEKLAPELDAIIVSDFVYGVITNRLLANIIKIAQTHNLLLFGDLQCSSQIGNVLKFNQFDALCPTEREARIALSDHENGLEQLALHLLKRTQVPNLLITLGAEGFVAYQTGKRGEVIQSQHFPALNSNPVDVAGAGDSLFAALSVALSAQIGLMETATLASCVAAIAVSRVGNTPVTRQELIQFLDRLTLSQQD